MANLRRHFNFNVKSPDRDMDVPPPNEKSPFQQLDKNMLMNDICSCLDLCSSYIQALNTLCGAGSALARNLSHTVREIPAYQAVSLQFLYIWEEASKATAGASAAVKTETLMMLQEILNSLEMGKIEEDIESTIAESFQVLGSCLCSFIELQAQFSLCTWKSLSKLSKYFTGGDTTRHSLQRSRPSSKLAKNSDLIGTIKKHFSQFHKVRSSKSSSSSEMEASPVFVPSMTPVFTPFQITPEETSVWSPTPSMWNSPKTVKGFSQACPVENIPLEIPKPLNSGLDEVINLLSCVPVDQPAAVNLNNDNYFGCNEQMYHMLPKLTRHVGGVHKTWSHESPLVSRDPWIWRNDNINCAALPATPQESNKEIQKWSTAMCETGSSSDDGSSIPDFEAEFYPNYINGVFGKHILNSFTNRKSTSGDSMPGGLENISESKEECLSVHSKISTWPFIRNSVDEN